MLSKREQVKDNNNKKVTGVFQRASSEKTFKGKPDICFDICYKYEGKLYWEKIGWLSQGYSVKNAVDTRNERIRSIRKNIELPQQKQKAPLFKTAKQDYFSYLESDRPRSVKQEKSRYKNSLEQFENKRLDEISAFDLEKLKLSMRKDKYSEQSIKHVLSLYRRIFNYAVSHGKWKGEHQLKTKTKAGVEMPMVSNERQRFLSHEEAALLLDELKKVSEQVYAIASLSLFCGLRAGEIFKLRGVDINFKEKTILIRNPKNNRNRIAFMPEIIETILKEYMPKDKNDYIFKDKKGRPVKEVSHTFDRVVSKLGLNNGKVDRLDKVVFHSLRHSFASWLAHEGNNLFIIMELMGHSSLSMVQRYAHTSKDAIKQAATRLEAAFNQSKESNVIQLNDN